MSFTIIKGTRLIEFYIIHMYFSTNCMSKYYAITINCILTILKCHIIKVYSTLRFQNMSTSYSSTINRKILNSHFTACLVKQERNGIGFIITENNFISGFTLECNCKI